MEGRLGRQAQVVVEGVNIRGTNPLVHDHPVFQKLAEGVNGDTDRAMRLFYNKSGELRKIGFVAQAQVFKHADRSRVFVVQSTDPNPSTRIRVAFRQDGILGMWHADKDKDKKALGALRSMGYRT